MTLIIDNHFFSLKPEHSQYGSFERITSRDNDRCSYARSGIDKDKMICDVEVRLALNRPECFRAFDGGCGEYRMARQKGHHAGLDVKMNIPLNPRLLSKRGIMNGLDF